MTLGSALYWICWPISIALVATAITQLREFVRRAQKELLRPDQRIGLLVGALACFILTLPYQLSRPSASRVLWDETIVNSTSLAMHFQRSAEIPIMAVPGPSSPVPVATAVDKRPPFFPFVVSLLHGLRGPAEENAQLLNLGLRVLFLVVVTFTLYLRGTALPVLAGVFLLLSSSPILEWVGSSGGIDLLATILTLWFLDGLTSFLARRESKHDARSFLGLLAPAAAAAYARYEVAALVLPGLALALWRIHAHSRGTQSHLRVATAGFLALLLTLVPLFLLLRHAGSSFVETNGKPLFGFSYISANLPTLIEAFLRPSLKGPFLTPASLLGLCAFLFVALTGRMTLSGTALGIASIFQISLLLVFSWGNALSSATARLFLLPSITLLLAPSLLFPAAPVGLSWKKQVRAWGPVSFLFFSVAVCLASLATREQPLFPPTREHAVKSELAQMAESLAANRQLLISSLHFYAVSLGLAAVSPAWYLEHYARLGPLANHVVWIRTPADDPYGLGRETEEALEKKLTWVSDSNPPYLRSVRVLRPTKPEGPAKK